MTDIFLDNIAWLRKHYGLTKKEMANKLGISVWMLNKIERGELPPTLEINVLFMVYKEFGIFISDLFEIRLEN